VLTGYDICVTNGIWPRTWFVEPYLLHSKLFLSFLDRLEGSSAKYFDATEAAGYVKRCEKEWIKYDTKFEK